MAYGDPPDPFSPSPNINEKKRAGNETNPSDGSENIPIIFICLCMHACMYVG